MRVDIPYVHSEIFRPHYGTLLGANSQSPLQHQPMWLQKIIDFSIPVAQTAHLVTTTKPATKASPMKLSGCFPTLHPTWRMQLELLYTMRTKKHTNSCLTLAHRSTCAGDARWRWSPIIVVGLRHQAVARRGANVPGCR